MVGFRFLTGLGIGGMLAATNAVTAEASTSKSARSVAMALYVIGYPLGGDDRRLRRVRPGCWPGLRLARGVPVRRGGDRGDDPARHAAGARRRRPSTPRAGPQARSRRSTARCARCASRRSTAMPDISPTAPKPKVTDILSNPRLRPVTLLLAFGYMFHTITFYYILKFAVQIVADFRRLPPARGGEHADLGQRRRLHRRRAVRLPDGASGTSRGRRSPTLPDRLGGGRRVRHGQRHAVGLARGPRS